ncbi:MAG TPA: hypothetical protein VGB56_08000 [Flavisolibacter sp.]
MANTNDPDDSEYAYGVHSLLVGTKYKVNRMANILLTTVASLNSLDNNMKLGLKPSFEINTTNKKSGAQVYYLKCIGSEAIRASVGSVFY